MQALSEQMVPALREIAESLSSVQECLLASSQGWKEVTQPVPLTACWYTAFHGDTCVYVGITKNLRNRLRSRDFMKHSQLTVLFLEMPINCNSEIAKMLEGVFARSLKPRTGFFIKSAQVAVDAELYGEQRCSKCAHTWLPRMTGFPSRCPACWSRRWNKSR